MTIAVKILADWDHNGNFTDTHDNIGDHIDPTKSEVTVARGKNQAIALSPSDAGEFGTTLQNQSRLFSGENEDSDLYGKVTPNVLVQVQVQLDAAESLLTEDGLVILTESGETLTTEGGAFVPLGTARTQDFNEGPEYGNEIVAVKGFGNFSLLIGNIISTPVFQDISISDAIHEVLDEAGWPADERDIDESDITLPIWWIDEDDAFEWLVILSNTEGGSLYESAAGHVVFENRYARLTQERSTESQFTFASTGSGGNVHAEPHYDKGRKDVINQASFTVREREIQEEQIIWELDTPFSLAPNEVRKFKVATSGGDPFLDAIVPSTSDGQNEIQVMTANADALAATGNLQLGFGGEQLRTSNKASSIQSPAFAHLSTAGTIQSKMQQLSTIGKDNLTVSGSLSGGMSFTFTGALAKRPVDLISISADLTGSGDPQVSIYRSVEGRKHGIVLSAGSLASVSFEDARDSGGSVNLIITAGSSGATIDSLRVRAKPITVTREHSITHSIDTSVSEDRYGAKPYPYSIWEGSDPAEVQALADMIVSLRQNPLSQFSFITKGNDADTLAFQVAAEIGTRVTIIEPQIGINGDFFIEHLRHVIDQFGIATRFSLERVPSGDVFGDGDGGFAIVGSWDLGVDRLAF